MSDDTATTLSPNDIEQAELADWRILFDALTPEQVTALRTINDAALARLLEEDDCSGPRSRVRGVGGPLS